jgi:CubicO group peptidase (beta-lactamase class C family)
MRNLVAGTALALLVAWSAGADEVPLATPESLGFDSGTLAEVVNAARASGQSIHSLTVVRKGAVLLDASFYPFDGALHDVASVTKSVTTTLVGIAGGEGLLDLDAPMLSFFPDLHVANRDARKEEVTVRQLAGNVSGLACIGAPAEVTLAEMQASQDFLQFALDLPMAHEPGTHFDYCSPGMHILSAIVQKATGMTASSYAQEKLFSPLGIRDAVWEADSQGISRGWGDLHLTPDDMVLLGLLWLEGGAWQGRQLIPADWLEQATTKAAPLDTSTKTTGPASGWARRRSL